MSQTLENPESTLRVERGLHAVVETLACLGVCIASPGVHICTVDEIFGLPFIGDLGCK